MSRASKIIDQDYIDKTGYKTTNSPAINYIKLIIDYSLNEEKEIDTDWKYMENLLDVCYHKMSEEELEVVGRIASLLNKLEDIRELKENNKLNNLKSV